MKRKLLFQGTGTALVTPFKDDGEIDFAKIENLVEFQIRAGVEAIIPAGTTGEGATLTDDEMARVAGFVVAQARKRVKIIAGAGSNSTAKTISLAKRMTAEGADGVLCVAPYYNKPTQEGFYRHYAAIASEIDIPIVMYNVPGRTSSNIEAPTVLRIAEEFPVIAGVKEASGNFNQISEILRHRPKGFGVWSGDDALTLPLIALGADGVISVVSNEVPKIFSQMVRHCLKKDFSAAARLHYRMLDLMNFNFIESSPIPVKAVLASMGMIGENYRLPMVPLSDNHRAKMKQIITELGL